MGFPNLQKNNESEINEMKIDYKKVQADIDNNDLNEFLKPILTFIPQWYNNFLLKSSELVPVNELPNKKYGGYEYILPDVNETIVFGKLYSFNEMKAKSKTYIDAQMLYPNTVIIGEEMNDGYFFLQTFRNGTYKIGFWDSNQIVPLPLDVDDYDNDNMNPHNSYYIADDFEQFFNSWSFVWD